MGKTRLAAALIVMWSLTGCSGGTPSMVQDGGRGDAQGGANGRTLRISESELEHCRLAEHWSTSVGGAIEQVWFLVEDLYLTTRGTDGYHLLKVDGETGLVDWSFGLTGRLEYRPTIYVYSDQVLEQQPTRFRELYFVQDDVIHCIDDEHGDLVYKIDAGVPVSTPVSASDSQVYVGSWNRRIFAYGKDSGIQEWTYLTDAPLVAPAELGKTSIYFGSEDSSLYCLNSGAGYDRDSSWIRSTGGKLTAAPVFYRGRVYVGSYDYKVYCFEEFRGHERWSYPAGAPIPGRLFPFKDSIFAVTQKERPDGDPESELISLHQNTGALQWAREGFTRVVAADSLHCFAVDRAGKLSALRAENGRTDWTLDTDRFDFVVGQDAQYGAVPELWGRIHVATRDGFIQSLRPRRR